MKLLRAQFEAIILRGLPGILNLYVLLLVGEWLGARQYGIFSTIIATSGLVANFCLGPATFGIIYHVPALDAEGRGADYDMSMLSFILIIALIILGAGVPLILAGVVGASWIAAAVTFAIYTAVQELLRARMRLHAYAVSSFAQSLLFFGLIYAVLRSPPDASKAVSAFAVSYAVAAMVSFYFVGRLRLCWPQRELLQPSLTTGVKYTVANLAEQGLYVGLRYIILFMGGTAMLSVFSFCLDLAQRLISFLVSATSFVTVPRAFRAQAQGDAVKFKRTLVEAAISSSVLCVAAVALTLTLQKLGIVSALRTGLFDPLSFAILAAACTLNRLKKMVVDSVAIRRESASFIAWGYIVGSPLALGLCATLLWAHVPYGAAISYGVGYIVAAVATLWLCRALRFFTLAKGISWR